MINSLLPLLRRFLLITTFAFWQGGFMFYGGVVVEVGTEIVGSHLVQGFVTQSVTNYLNAAGVVCIALWCWDFSSEKDRRWLAPELVPVNRRFKRVNYGKSLQ